MGGGVRLVESMGAVTALFGWLTARVAVGSRLHCVRGGGGREKERRGREGEGREVKGERKRKRRGRESEGE